MTRRKGEEKEKDEDEDKTNYNPNHKETPRLASLIADIDTYMAEQAAYERARRADPRSARPRADSRGTLFVDVDEEGGMVASYRHPRRSLRESAPSPAPSPRRGRWEDEDEDEASAQYVGSTTQAPPSRRRAQRAALPNEFYVGGCEGVYPRAMRRVEKPDGHMNFNPNPNPNPNMNMNMNMNVDTNKPLPPLPPEPETVHRKRRSVVEAVTAAVRKLCSSPPLQRTLDKSGMTYGVERWDGGYVFTRRGA
ncbi:hypothetical protein PMIN04_003452 [Paraphaeosphaeria minitans]